MSGRGLPASLRGAAAAIVSGSGLAVVPDGVEVVDEIEYGRLGWPVTGVTGHPSRVLVGRWSRTHASPQPPTVLLCCGRPHRYEGWSAAELRRPIEDLAEWGVSRLVSTNACGSLAGGPAPGSAVIVDQVVDLQSAPDDEPLRIAGTSPRLAANACAAVATCLPARRGRYVAVAGPAYETPAEAAWLAGLADVVGMSTAPEAAAAGDRGLELCILSLVVNRSGVSVGHDEVLAAGARLQRALRPALAALLEACWPAVFASAATPAASAGPSTPIDPTEPTRGG